MWFDKTFVYFNSGVHGNKRSDMLKSNNTGSDFSLKYLNVLLPE